ncbi:MAG: hypothetical protein GXP14_10480 [Gammaproteobacteria bacterium]|nr:hypothetical protein [Gammaproteobacteria bacterium]
MSVAEFRQSLHEIKGLIGATETDFDQLRKHQGFLLENLDEVIAFFYDILYENSGSRDVFTEGEREKREQTLRDWVVALLEGHDEDSYWRAQYLVGLAHVRRKVANRYMISIANRLKEFYLPKMIDQLGTEEGIKTFISFQRILDSGVALTVTLVDEAFKMVIEENTGWTEALMQKMQESVFVQIAKKFQTE